MEPNSKIIPQQNTQNPAEWRQDLVTDMYSDIGPINNALKSIGFNPDDLALLRSEATDFILQKNEVADFSANCFKYSSSPEEKINQFIDIVIATIEKAGKEQALEGSNTSTTTRSGSVTDTGTTTTSTNSDTATEASITPSKSLSILTETLKNSGEGSGNTIDSHRRAILDEIENPTQSIKPIDIPLPRTMPNTTEVLQNAITASSLDTENIEVKNEDELANIIDPFKKTENSELIAKISQPLNQPLEAPVNPLAVNQKTNPAANPIVNSVSEIKSNLDSKLNNPTVSQLKESFKVADPYREQF